jgi:tetratricopeptide (TPR) repeat protein
LLPGAAAQVPGQSREPNTPADTNALQSLALQEAQAGNSDEAIRDYQRVLAVRPEWKEGWWNLGTLQYSSNHFADARSSFLKVVGFAPAMGTAWSLLGLSEFETKDFSDSLAHLEKAQSLGIEDDEIRRVSVYHLGLLLVRNSNFTRARDLLLATFGTGEMSPQLKYVLGLALLRVPLLPDEIDPSKESLVSAAGDIASAGGDVLTRFPGFVTSYPDVPYVHYEYGLALGKAGRDKEALVEMQKETKVSPGSPLPWLEISRLELHGGETGESDAAAAKAKTLESVNRSNREQRILLLYSGVNAEGHSTAEAEGGTELWSRAMQEYAAAMYAPAIADLKPWLMKHPDNGTGWAVLGLSEFALHDFDNALIHLERGETLGLSGSPESLQAAKYTLGILLIRAGEFDRASELLAAALKMTPHDEKIEYALGLSLLRKAGLPQQENQKQAQLVTTAGEIAALLQDSRYDAAFPMFKSLLQQYPSVPFLHYAYGTALLALSQFDEAATQMQAEISISPRSELPYIRLASIRLREDRPADAIPFARQALALSPQSAEAHYLLGRASLENGDDATALHELEVAARLSPDSPEVHFNLAKAYSRAKMPEAAAKERADFVRLNQISENQKSQSGNQMYAGPHDTVNVNHPSQKPD